MVVLVVIVIVMVVVVVADLSLFTPSLDESLAQVGMDQSRRKNIIVHPKLHQQQQGQESCGPGVCIRAGKGRDRIL
ncbi:hypothetical protein E2C01_025735 [Portunus trituberculatus]|uniref:Secreted protein n=1 Tax=Portunus trituberculatus TaxID=210409 RepID=A0A5B7EGA7_PORTR|nr:hypothetical protein [Portunus trituberculatus]